MPTVNLLPQYLQCSSVRLRKDFSPNVSCSYFKGNLICKNANSASSTWHDVSLSYKEVTKVSNFQTWTNDFSQRLWFCLGLPTIWSNKRASVTTRLVVPLGISVRGTFSQFFTERNPSRCRKQNSLKMIPQNALIKFWSTTSCRFFIVSYKLGNCWKSSFYFGAIWVFVMKSWVFPFQSVLHLCSLDNP